MASAVALSPLKELERANGGGGDHAAVGHDADPGGPSQSVA